MACVQGTWWGAGGGVVGGWWGSWLGLGFWLGCLVGGGVFLVGPGAGLWSYGVRWVMWVTLWVSLWFGCEYLVGKWLCIQAIHCTP